MIKCSFSWGWINCERTSHSNGYAINRSFSDYEADVVIPSQVGDTPIVEIANNAFNSSPMYSVVIPDSITTFGVGAFYSCKNLKSVQVPDSVEKISSLAFFRCKNLQTVILNEGVREISYEAFGSCEQLKSITIPASVKVIHPTAFNDCSNLKFVCSHNSYAENWVLENYGPSHLTYTSSLMSEFFNSCEQGSFETSVNSEASIFER